MGLSSWILEPLWEPKLKANFKAETESKITKKVDGAGTHDLRESQRHSDIKTAFTLSLSTSHMAAPA